MTQQENTNQNSSEKRADLAGDHPGINALRKAKGIPRDYYQANLPPTKGDQAGAAPQESNTSPQTGVMATEVPSGTTQQPSVQTQSNQEQLPPETKPDEVNWEKRYADARRFHEDLQSEIKDLKAQLEQVTQQSVVLPKTDAELETWKQEHPTLYDTVLTLIRKEGELLTSELSATKKELEEVKRARQKEELFLQVLNVHKDADQIRKSDKFKEWFGSQSQAVKNLIESTNSHDIITGINLYKMETGTSQSSQPQEIEPSKGVDAASAVDTKTASYLPTVPKEWTEQEIASLSPSQYAKYREQIRASRLEQRKKVLGSR